MKSNVNIVSDGNVARKGIERDAATLYILRDLERNRMGRGRRDKRAKIGKKGP